MRIYKTRAFARFARQERIADASLREAANRAERGLVDADLGGGVIKQRVARRGQGRSGGYRVLIGFRARTHAVFLFGFAKSDRQNISGDELATLRDLAKIWLEADGTALARATNEGVLLEANNGDDKEDDKEKD